MLDASVDDVQCRTAVILQPTFPCIIPRLPVLFWTSGSGVPPVPVGMVLYFAGSGSDEATTSTCRINERQGCRDGWPPICADSRNLHASLAVHSRLCMLPNFPNKGWLLLMAGMCPALISTTCPARQPWEPLLRTLLRMTVQFSSSVSYSPLSLTHSRQQGTSPPTESRFLPFQPPHSLPFFILFFSSLQPYLPAYLVCSAASGTMRSSLSA